VLESDPIAVSLDFFMGDDASDGHGQLELDDIDAVRFFVHPESTGNGDCSVDLRAWRPKYVL